MANGGRCDLVRTAVSAVGRDVEMAEERVLAAEDIELEFAQSAKFGRETMYWMSCSEAVSHLCMPTRMSPGRMPSFAAGLFGRTSSTRMPPR